MDFKIDKMLNCFSKQTDEAAKAEHRDRIQELWHFINSQPRSITKFDDTLVRKLLKDVKVCDVFIEFRFKSGTSVIIEK